MKTMDYIKANRKGLRDAELEFNNGWTSKSAIHISNKQYKRNPKHKSKLI